MPLEVATNIAQLDNTWPLLGDSLSETGGHLRQLKQILKDMFPGSGGNGYAIPIEATEDEIDFTIGLLTNVQTELDSIANNGVIVSGFIPYSGLFASIPTGWQLCDGTNGTPNLADTFIFGTVTEADVGNAGGSADTQVTSHLHALSHTHTASLAQDPDHTHPILTDVVDTTTSTNPTANQFTSLQETLQSDVTGSHSHVITTDNVALTTGNTGSSGVGANNPEYIRLAYIMRVA